VISRTHYVLVGLFVLVLGTAFVAGILWISAGGSVRAWDTYLVYMEESVAGLNRDSAVKYHGVDVGRVVELGLDPKQPQRVRLVLQLDKGTPVREDTVAILEAQGLTGLAYINLTGGGRDSPPLGKTPGEPWPVIPSRPSVWGRLDRSVAQLIENLAETSQRLQAVLDDDNRRHLAATLASLDTLSTTLAGHAGDLSTALADLRETLRNSRKASAGLPRLVKRFEATADALQGMADELSVTSEDVRHTVVAGGREVRAFTTEALPEATATLRELRRAATNLRRFSDRLRRNPGILLQETPVPPPGPGEE